MADTARPGAARWQVSWLGLVGMGLVLALLAVVVVQARQFSLLRQAFDSGNDYGVLTLFQAETDYLRLRAQWHAADDERVPLDGAALRHRYRLWVDHVARLRADRPKRLLGDADDDRHMVAQIDAFIAAADRALGQQPQIEPSRSFVAALVPALDALDPAIHDIAVDGARRLGVLLEQRAQALRWQNRLGLGLTVSLSILTLAFAAIALRQVRQLRERRMVLETLANHLGEAQRAAESASEAKSAFLANMSHEIRTPFHGLMGMLSLLRESGLAPRQIDYLHTATASADHLLALLNDILDMSQLESGRMTLAPVAVDLRMLLHDVEALMRPQAMAKSLALHIGADAAVPERVLADATRVKQIVFNLLSNAIKFSERGAVVLDLRCRPPPHERAPAQLEFVVKDNGIGIDEATQARLFNRFMQADSSPSRRHGGTGLGLEISRNLARLMGGDIQVRSKPGEGSSFTFRMPLHAVQDAPARRGDTAASVAPARPLRVLVAEDHPVNRQYMAALLDNMGHVGHFTTNGLEATDALQTAGGGHFDLVLMDLHMPVQDGVAATRAIRALADPQLATIPIVALTADAFDETRERCLVAGMNDFLTKPVSPQKLATSLRRLFGSETAALPATPHAPAVPPHGAAPARGLAPLVDEAAIAVSLQAMPASRLGSMIHAFLDQGPDTVQRLRAAVRDAQPLDLRVNAHAAKGAALNLGLAGLAATAEALQEGAAHLPAHEIAHLVQRFEQQLPQTRSAVVAFGLLPALPGPK